MSVGRSLLALLLFFSFSSSSSSSSSYFLFSLSLSLSLIETDGKRRMKVGLDRIVLEPPPKGKEKGLAVVHKVGAGARSPQLGRPLGAPG